MNPKQYPTIDVLTLACAAQRVNGAYIKQSQAVHTADGLFTHYQHPNKMCMLTTLDANLWTADPADCPMPLRVTPEDSVLAHTILKHFRKFLFSAIAGENDFQNTINTILSADTVMTKEFGYVACLPSVYLRDLSQGMVQKAAAAVESGFLGEPTAQLKDLDAKIISSIKSKNFEGYNIDAIINGKMVSWINKTELATGDCVLIKAKVKAHGTHWKHGNDVTRLNYVKAVQ